MFDIIRYNADVTVIVHCYEWMFYECSGVWSLLGCLLKTLVHKHTHTSRELRARQCLCFTVSDVSEKLMKLFRLKG